MVHSSFNQRGPWSATISPTEVAKRAGGRRRFNATRALRAAVRRQQVLSLLLAYGFDYGSQRRAAKALGVTAATISRDTKELRAWWLRSGGMVWPMDLRTPKGAGRVIDRMVAKARNRRIAGNSKE